MHREKGRQVEVEVGGESKGNKRGGDREKVEMNREKGRQIEMENGGNKLEY